MQQTKRGRGRPRKNEKPETMPALEDLATDPAEVFEPMPASVSEGYPEAETETPILPGIFRPNVRDCAVHLARSNNALYKITSAQAELFAKEKGDFVTVGDGFALVDLDKRKIRYYVENVLSQYSVSPIAKRLEMMLYGLGFCCFLSIVAIFRGGGADISEIKKEIEAARIGRAATGSAVWTPPQASTGTVERKLTPF